MVGEYIKSIWQYDRPKWANKREFINKEISGTTEKQELWPWNVSNWDKYTDLVHNCLLSTISQNLCTIAFQLRGKRKKVQE